MRRTFRLFMHFISTQKRAHGKSTFSYLRLLKNPIVKATFRKASQPFSREQIVIKEFHVRYASLLRSTKMS